MGRINSHKIFSKSYVNHINNSKRVTSVLLGMTREWLG